MKIRIFDHFIIGKTESSVKKDKTKRSPGNNAMHITSNNSANIGGMNDE